MKLVATISDFGAAANIGGDVERTSFVIEVDPRVISRRVKDHINNKNNCSKWATLSFSLLDEEDV